MGTEATSGRPDHNVIPVRWGSHAAVTLLLLTLRFPSTGFAQAVSPAAQTGSPGFVRPVAARGARSLLVSHWRVRDNVAPRLIPTMLLAGREHPEFSRAQALRQASLAILDDRTLNAADPAAWAPFTLVGEAGR